jgi:hypothetical protein
LTITHPARIHITQLDSVDHIPDPIKVGEALAQEVKVEHFRLDHFGQFYH